MLAHELRRRMAAVRVAGEAIAVLRSRGLDTTPMLDLLLAEVGDLDALAGEVLGDRGRPAEAGARAAPEAAVPDVAGAVQAAARTVAVAGGRPSESRPASRPRSRPARPCSARRSRT